MKRLVIILAVMGATSALAHAQSQSDVLVEQTAPPTADAGTDVSFSVVVTNLGPDPASSVELLDPLPAGMTFVSASSPSSWGCTTPAVGTNGTIDCTIAQLEASQPAAFMIVAHVDPSAAPGTYFTNIATGSTATPDPNGENDAATASVQTPPPPAADLLVMLQGPSATNPNTDVTYAIDVLNGGPGDATNVTLTLALPGNIAFMPVTQNSGPAFGCASAPGTITCSIATLVAGASPSFTLSGHVPSGTADGTRYQLFATVASDYDPNAENDQTPTLVCVQLDSCSAGPCNANVAVVCPPSPDQCHDAPTCDTVTGACPTKPKTDGASCDDGDACTQTDTCQAGVCSGASPVVCATADACHSQGTCDPATGACAANPTLADDTPCDDSNACTQTDRCASGSCVGANPVICSAAGSCQSQGACVPATGVCAANAPMVDDTPCDDGNACTQTDGCASGVCVGANPVVCSAVGSCENQGTCNPATGACAATPKVDGTACDDGDACTSASSCQAGACVGSAPVTCAPAGQCEVQAACDPGTGTCAANAHKPDGTSCDDADACTEGDVCQSGACKGVLVVACADNDAGSTDADMHADAGQSAAGQSGGTSQGGTGGEGTGGTSQGGTGGTSQRGTGGTSHAGTGGARALDAGADAANADASTQPHAGSGGCSCRLGADERSRPASGSLLLALFVAAIFLARRARISRS